MGEKVNIRLCSAKLLTMSVAYNFTLSTCNAGWGGGGGGGKPPILAFFGGFIICEKKL